ncbi:hypothetical protein TWF281_003303 [Arthrobotrys megalospora]
MPYDLEPEIRQCEKDSKDEGASFCPVFCTTPLTTEDIKSIILATHVDPKIWNSEYVFLDTINSTPSALSSITHATRHPSPPLTSPFSESWTPRDFYNFFNLYIRNKPNESGHKGGHFTNFTFLIVSPSTLSSPSRPVIVCTDALDFYESETSPPVLKTLEMPFTDAVTHLDTYEYCIGCISEYGLDRVMNQQPAAIIADVEHTSDGFFRGKIANADEMRANRFIAVRKWEGVMKADGTEDDCKARVARVTYKDE